MKIREELIPERRSYALDTPESGTGLLDCSMGENPYGFPDCVREAWRSFELARMCRYPHSRAIHDEVVRYWADYAFIEPGNVVPTDGSISALSDRDFPASHSAEFASAKRALRSALGKGLSMRDTDDRVPICTLTHEDESIDLQALLLRHGVLTCSGREFEPLGQNSVRLRIPRREDVDRLLASVCAAAMD